MIVSVSGKIGSGKDTVGEIIRYLSTNPSGNQHHSKTITFEAFREFSYSSQAKRCEWQIKKFADKLKDIVCIILGCTREQLEDRDYKEKELGEEWWYYGAYQHGFASDTLQSIHPKKEDAEYILEYSLMNSVRLVKLTPRKILQLLGTEAGRGIIHPNIWVNSMFSEYIGVDKFRAETPEYPWQFPNWIITDTRFPNELEAVKERGGITIVVKRPETDHLAGDHASETALDNSTFDEVIVNDGSLEDLIEKVKEILARREII
jgi:hypothetical protein